MLALQDTIFSYVCVGDWVVGSTSLNTVDIVVWSFTWMKLLSKPWVYKGWRKREEEICTLRNIAIQLADKQRKIFQNKPEQPCF